MSTNHDSTSTSTSTSTAATSAATSGGTASGKAAGGAESSLAERRARFVYDSARLAAMAMQAPVVSEPWEERDEAFQERFGRAVARQCDPDRARSPRENHAGWRAEHEADGWQWGPVRDGDAKTHPRPRRLRPARPARERNKNEVWAALCDIARQRIVA